MRLSEVGDEAHETVSRYPAKPEGKAKLVFIGGSYVWQKSG